MIKLHWLSVIIYICTITFISLIHQASIPAPRYETHKMKYILQWTSPDTDPFNKMGKGRQEFLERRCPINNCFITSDKDILNSIKDFDAILFHGPEFTQKKNVTFPTERSLHQKYIFVSRESQSYYKLDSPRYDNFFNWTFTYKLDSDIYFGYIIIRDQYGRIIGPKINMKWKDMNYMKTINRDFKNKLKSKKFAVAWFVSNCQSFSGREKLALKLRQELYIRGLALDIYTERCGWKGRKWCPKNAKNVAGMDCLRKLETDYYFYLSFENSLGEDYITEKLLNAVQHHVVPIVYSGADYNRFLPEGSYLNANKLRKRELVSTIAASIVNKELYYNFFKWTNHYSYHSADDSPETDYMCSLCSALNDKLNVKHISTYENMREWWNSGKSRV